MLKRFLLFAFVIVTIVLSACGPATIAVSDGELNSQCDIFLETSLGEFSLKISTEKIDFTIKPGESKNVMKITSPKLGGFQFCGYPDVPTNQANVTWETWSGGILFDVDVRIRAYDNAIPGIYIGKVLLMDLTTHTAKEISFKMKVLK